MGWSSPVGWNTQAWSGGAAVGVAPIVANQTAPFGALTASGAGGWTPINTGAAITSASIDSGNTGTHFAISSAGVITPTAGGDTADLASGPYTLGVTFNSAGGSDTATITIPTSGTDADGNDLAKTRSVAPSTNEAQLENATENASLARGEFILLRTGNYNIAQADRRTVRGTAIGAGTGGFVTIAPHVGAVPVIGRWSVYGTTIQDHWFWFKNLTFLGTNDGTYAGSAGGLLFFENCVANCKVSGCTFSLPSTADTAAGSATLTNGIAISDLGNSITNGTFASDTAWTKDTGVTISGGVAHWTAAADDSGLSQADTFVVGKVYEVVFTVANYVGGGVYPSFTGGTPVLGTEVNANGRYVQLLTAATGNTALEFASNGASTTLDIDTVTMQPQYLAHIEISDNTFTNCFGGVNGVGQDVTITGNTVDWFFNDAFKMSGHVSRLNGSFNHALNARTPHTQHVVTGITKGATTVVHLVDATGIIVAADMVLDGVVGMTEINNLLPKNITVVAGTDVTIAVNSSGFSNYISGGAAYVTGAHGDMWQGGFSDAATGGLDDITLEGNIFERGTATSIFPGDKQMIFLSDNVLGKIRRAKINGNLLIGYGTSAGIAISYPEDSQVKNNTAVSQLGLSTTSNMNVNLFGSGTGNTVVNNIYNSFDDDTTGTVNENNTILTINDTSGYQAVFVNPTTAVPALTNYAVLSGTVGAAGSGLINYVSHTMSIPPWLSNATGVETVPGTASVAVWTDSGGGTVYAVGTGSSTGPTKAQVKAGQDHTGAAALDADTTSPTVPGTQTLTMTLTSGTRYVHWMHEISSLQSDVETSASFTVTSASGSLAAQFLLMEAA